MFSQEELDSFYLSDIVEQKAMLNSGVFDSLLTVAVKQDRKHTTSVFIFQCEDTRVRAKPTDTAAIITHK